MSGGMSGESYMESDFYNDSAYTQDISTKMRVPDRLTAHGGAPGTSRNGDPHHVAEAAGHMYGMQVPDRILLNGTDPRPRELQLEQSVLPPTPEHVRVQTPPRSIKLEELTYPAADEAVQTPEHIHAGGKAGKPVGTGASTKSSSFEADLSLRAGESSESLSVYEEVQVMRRQIAKLNHRVMAVELENQQSQQREMAFTVLCAAYFLVKAVAWLNKAY